MTYKGLALAGGLVFVAAWMLDLSQPKVTPLEGPFVTAELTTNTYLVSGGNLNALRRNLNRKGPRGHWGIARSQWTYDADCNVSFRAKITVPKLASRWRLSSSELAVWDKMKADLDAHELWHVETARQAAIMIKEVGCDPKLVAEIEKEERKAQVRFDLAARKVGAPGYVSLSGVQPE